MLMAIGSSVRASASRGFISDVQELRKPPKGPGHVAIANENNLMDLLDLPQFTIHIHGERSI